MKNLFSPNYNPRLAPGDHNLALVIHFTALVGFAGHFLFIFLFLWLGIRQMAWLNLASCAIFGVCFWLNKRGTPHLALLLGALEVSAHAVIAVRYAGWESGFHYYIIGLIPLIFYSQSWRLATRLFLAGCLCGLYIGLYLVSLSLPPLALSDPARIRFVGVVNIITLFIVFSALAYYYRLAATNAEIALKKANQKLKLQAHFDSLTNLPNRHDIKENMELLVAGYRANAEPFCVILTDIDDFKIYNDTYGHQAGDEILIRVARTLQSCMRGHDLVGRWGGEEFLVLLPGTRTNGARLVAERMRQKIGAMRVVTGMSESSITMTFGIAEFENDRESADCIDRADQAMYKGKISGKNCVKVFSE